MVSHVTTSDSSLNIKSLDDLPKRKKMTTDFSKRKTFTSSLSLKGNGLINNHNNNNTPYNAHSTLHPQLENFDFTTPDTIDNMIKITSMKSIMKKHTKSIESQSNNNPQSTLDADKELLRKLKEPAIDDYRKTHSFLSIQQSQSHNGPGLIDQIIPDEACIPEDKIFNNDSFNPGQFESFDFENRIQHCIYSSLIDKPDKIDRLYSLDQFNTTNTVHKSSSMSYNDSFDLTTNEWSNIKLIDQCLSEHIDLYSNKKSQSKPQRSKAKERAKARERSKSKHKTKTQRKPKIALLQSEVREDEEDNRRLYASLKAQAVPEFKRLLMFYQQTTSISNRTEISYVPIREDELDKEIANYFRSLIQEERSKYLKNKLKIIMKLINNVDKITQLPVYHNSIKNELFRYWKSEYEKEVEEFTQKKKNELYEQIKKEDERKTKKMQSALNANGGNSNSNTNVHTVNPNANPNANANVNVNANMDIIAKSQRSTSSGVSKFNKNKKNCSKTQMRMSLGSSLGKKRKELNQLNK